MLRLLCLLACLAVIASFAGSIHRSFDTLALGLPIYALFCLLSALASRRPGWSVAVALACSFAGGWRVGPAFTGGDDVSDSLRIYSKNLLAGNRDWQGIADDIIAQQIDVVLLQEVSIYNDGILTGLEAEYPHQHLCRFSGWSGMAVLSRLPFTASPDCSERRALAAAQVEWRGEPLWILSVHIPWLWPYGDERHEAAAAEMLDGLDGKMLLAGDFNSFPWTHRVDDLARRAGGALLGPSRPTYRLRGVPLFLDHVIAPDGWVGEMVYRPMLGGDHMGVIAEVRPVED